MKSPSQDITLKIPCTPYYRQHFHFFFVEYLFSASIEKRDAIEIGRHNSGSSCPSTAPNPLWFASHTISLSFCISKYFSSTLFATWHFRFLKTAWLSVVHRYSIFLLSRGRNGADYSISTSIYLLKLWTDPINILSCDSARGGLSVLIGSAFRINGEIRSRLFYTQATHIFVA